MSSYTQSISKTDSPIFSNHIASIEMLDVSNHSTWAFEISLWLSGLGYESHLKPIFSSYNRTQTMDKD